MRAGALPAATRGASYTGWAPVLDVAVGGRVRPRPGHRGRSPAGRRRQPHRELPRRLLPARGHAPLSRHAERDRRLHALAASPVSRRRRDRPARGDRRRHAHGERADESRLRAVGSRRVPAAPRPRLVDRRDGPPDLLPVRLGHAAAVGLVGRVPAGPAADRHPLTSSETKRRSAHDHEMEVDTTPTPSVVGISADQ